MTETTNASEGGRKVTLMVWLAAIMVFLIVAPVFFVKFVLTPEFINARVVPEIESALGREVEFEDLSLGFRGLSLKGLRVSEDPAFVRTDTPDFAVLDRLLLRVKLLPLLQRRIVIREVVLGDPVIVVHRNAAGEFNFASLAAQSEADATTASSEKTQEPAPAGTDDAADSEDASSDDADSDDAEPQSPQDSKPVVSVLANRVRLQNARILVVDESAEAGPFSSIELRKFNLEADGVSLDEPFETVANLELVLDDLAPFDLEMGLQFQPEGPFIGAELELPKLDLDALLAHIAERSGDEDESESSEPTDLSGYLMQGKVVVGTLIAGGVTFGDLAVDLEVLAGKLSVSKAEAKLGGGTLTATADVDLNSKDLPYSATLALDQVGLNAFANAIGEGPISQLAGTLGFRIEVAGPSAPDTEAWAKGRLAAGEEFVLESLRLKNGSLAYLASPGAGVISLDAMTLTADRIRLNEASKFQFSTKIAAPSGTPIELKADGSIDLPKSRVDLALSAPEVALDPIMEALGSSASADPNQADSGEEIGPIETGPIAVGLIADITKLTASSMLVEQLHVEASVGSGKAKLTKMDATVAGGTASANANVDLARKGLAYDADVRVAGARAADLVSPFWNESWGAITGTMGFGLDIKGAGTTTEALERNLNGKGNLALDGGSYSGSTLMAALATFSRVKELASLTLVDSGGDFRIGDGVITTDRMLLGGAKQRVILDGNIGLGGALDLEARIGTAPGESNPVAQAMDNVLAVQADDGWTEVPVAVGGTTSSPSPSIPKRALADKAKQVVGEKLEGAIGEEAGSILRGLGILGGSPAKPAEPAAEPAANDSGTDPKTAPPSADSAPDAAPAQQPAEGEKETPPPNAVNDVLKGLDGLFGR